MAAAISVSESVSNPDKYNRINIQGSENVLEVKKFHRIFSQKYQHK